MFPLPASYVIFRAPSEESGHKWMTAIELSLRCTNAALGAKHRDSITASGSVLPTANAHHGHPIANLQAMQSIDRSDDELANNLSGHDRKSGRIYNDSEIERHFGE